MFDRILVPTDGSVLADRALEYAVDVATRYDAALHVATVLDAWEGSEGSDASTIDDRFDAAREHADMAAMSITESILRGQPSEAILEYVAEHDIDLIVMGTHGRSGIERLLIGSVAEHVIREAPVPVMTVRE